MGEQAEALRDKEDKRRAAEAAHDAGVPHDDLWCDRCVVMDAYEDATWD